MTELGLVRALLVDMDGVLFRGRTALPGATDFLPWLDAKGIRYRLLTNNSTLTPEDNARALEEKGIAVDPTTIMTSSLAAAAYLKEKGAAGRTAFVIGESGLRTALESAGLRLTDDYTQAAWLVTGLDRTVTYEKLRGAALAIQSGAVWVATNADTSLPIEEGLAPGAGAIAAALTATTGATPVVIGKPEPRMLISAITQLGVTAGETAALGDRLDTDVEAASRAGIASILVLTGVSTRAQAESFAHAPNVIVQGLPELMATWP